LETELNQFLVEPFVQSLNGNKAAFLKINRTGKRKGKPIYFTYLAKVVDKKNFPEVTSLTLGQYHFVLEHTLGGEYALREYGDFLNELSSTHEVTVGRNFLKKLHTVTKTYRNAIAHLSQMDKKQCRHLRELVFGGEAALLKKCSRIERKKLGS